MEKPPHNNNQDLVPDGIEMSFVWSENALPESIWLLSSSGSVPLLQLWAAATESC